MEESNTPYIIFCVVLALAALGALWNARRNGMTFKQIINYLLGDISLF